MPQCKAKEGARCVEVGLRERLNPKKIRTPVCAFVVQGRCGFLRLTRYTSLYAP